MNLTKKILAGAAVLMVSTVGAQAADVPFSGNVSASCTLTVDSNGTLAANTAATVLGSAEAGGVRGQVTAAAVGTGFTLSVANPTGFTANPTGGDTDVAFSSIYSATGATTVSDVAGGSGSALNSGTSVATIGMTATKSSGIFPPGAYSSVVVVTCS